MRIRIATLTDFPDIVALIDNEFTKEDSKGENAHIKVYKDPNMVMSLNTDK